MEQTFAEYILNEKDWVRKLEIAFYLKKKAKIFFDKSVIFKTELTKLFIETMKLDVDKNLVITACLLCNCKKIECLKFSCACLKKGNKCKENCFCKNCKNK